jgi:hypothetical protein
MRGQRIVRTLAAAGLIGAGWVLTRAARGFRQAADVVTPEGELEEGPAGPVVAASAGPLATDQAPSVSAPPTVAAPEGPSHVRSPETHIDELASKNASDVIAAVDQLSTEELGQLYEHEQQHKKRKTVLQAIEKALAPAG